MKNVLLFILYTVLGIAILGIRLAVHYLSTTELSLFVLSAVVIGFGGTLLHLGFSTYSKQSGLNGTNSPKFKYTMIAITYIGSLVVYGLVLALSGQKIDFNLELVVYVIILPSVLLALIASYYIGLEREYNEKLSQLKN